MRSSCVRKNPESAASHWSYRLWKANGQTAKYVSELQLDSSNYPPPGAKVLCREAICQPPASQVRTAENLAVCLPANGPDGALSTE